VNDTSACNDYVTDFKSKLKRVDTLYDNNRKGVNFPVTMVEKIYNILLLLLLTSIYLFIIKLYIQLQVCEMIDLIEIWTVIIYVTQLLNLLNYKLASYESVRCVGNLLIVKFTICTSVSIYIWITFFRL